MQLTELKKHFAIFIFSAGIVSLILIVFPFVEPSIKTYVNELFGASDSAMGETATELFVNILKIFKIILWMALVVAIVRFLNSLIFGAALRNTSNQETSGLLRNVVSIIIYIVAFFTIYKSQYPNHDLTTLFAGSTIIGVVLGLALQDTLGNLFAGLSLQADQPFEIGDVISITNRGTGVVESVSWRGIKIRTFQNKLLIISNSSLGKEAIEVAPRNNLNSRLVSFNTLYSDSPTKTIHHVREAVRQIENVSPKMRPVVRIRNLGESGIEWEVKYWLEDYTRFNDTDALIRQRIWYVFRRENIEFSYPTRTIHVETKPQEDVFEETDDDIFERLSNVPLFAPLNDDETRKLAKNSLVRVFAPDEVIVRKGQPGGSMFVVHRGLVKIQVVEDKTPRFVAELNESDIFGEMGLFTGAPRSADVVAIEETEVLEIKHSAIKPLFEDNPNLVEAISQTIAERGALLAQKTSEHQNSEPLEPKSIFHSIKNFFGLD